MDMIDTQMQFKTQCIHKYEGENHRIFEEHIKHKNQWNYTEIRILKKFVPGSCGTRKKKRNEKLKTETLLSLK